MPRCTPNPLRCLAVSLVPSLTLSPSLIIVSTRVNPRRLSRTQNPAPAPESTFKWGGRRGEEGKKNTWNLPPRTRPLPPFLSPSFSSSPSLTLNGGGASGGGARVSISEVGRHEWGQFENRSWNKYFSWDDAAGINQPPPQCFPPLVITPTLPVSLPLILSGSSSPYPPPQQHMPPSAPARMPLFIVILLISCFFPPLNKNTPSGRVCVCFKFILPGCLKINSKTTEMYNKSREEQQDHPTLFWGGGWTNSGAPSLRTTTGKGDTLTED